MKKVIITILTFFMACIIYSVPASAKDYTENGFTYRVDEKDAIVTGTEIKEGDIVIPASLGGFTVTEIDEEAFEKTAITSVVIPDTVKYIGYSAFEDAEKLVSVKMPRELTGMGNYAFAGCSSLKEVWFNEKLKSIGKKAFAECISLKKVILPDGVKKIETGTFDRCYKLNTVKFGDKTETIGERAFFKNYALKSVRIPKSVVKVNNEAFYKCGDLTQAVFENEKTKLGTGIFAGCTSLKKVSLPKKLNNIPERLFYNCTSLASVKLPENAIILKKKAFYNCKKLKSVKMSRKTYAIGDSTFAYSGLTKLDLSPDMQFIGNGAFQGTKITNLELKSKITYIGKFVFADCRKLKTIYIPASVKGINMRAFNNCTSLKAIYVAAGNAYYCSQDGVLYDKGKTKLLQYPLNKTSSSFRTPSSLQTVPQGSFSGNPYLKSVVISARYISNDAFSGASKLETVVINSGTVKIGSGAFAECECLKNITIPGSVQEIGSHAFESCDFTRFRIPSGLRKMGTGVFDGCSRLAAFEGGSAYYRTDNGVLYNGSKTELIKYPPCKSDKKFTAPDSVKVVRSEAFNHVSKLTEIEFGPNITSMKWHSIYYLKNLKSVAINSKNFKRGSSSCISECDRLAVVVGPDNYIMRRIADKTGTTLISL